MKDAASLAGLLSWCWCRVFHTKIHTLDRYSGNAAIMVCSRCRWQFVRKL